MENKEKSPNTYEFIIENTSGENQNAVIFGHNEYIESANFGSDSGIIIHPKNQAVSYVELLKKSGEERFRAGVFRFESENKKQLEEVLTITIREDNGQSATLPIILSSYSYLVTEIYPRFYSLDIPYNLILDRTSWLTTKILPNTQLFLTILKHPNPIN